MTGASVGLGQAMAVALAEAGADTACHCMFAGEANETCAIIKKLGRRAFSVSGDLSDQETSKKIAASVFKKFGRI